MTIYVKNNTSKDLKLPYNGEVYLFVAEGISTVDETVLSYEKLLRFYGYNNGYPNVSLISQPAQGEIDEALPALQVYDAVPPNINTLIENNTGIIGESNKYRFEYLLLEEALQNSNITITPASPITILSGGTNIGNITLAVPESTVFGIQNFGSSALNFTIGNVSINLASESSFEETFNAFTSVDIITTSSYNWFTK